MLYNLLVPFSDDFIIFNLFRYITFRTGAAILTALVISFVIGPHFIRWLKRKQAEGQPIRKDGPETHFRKMGTPTMGGGMIIFSVTVATLLWADLANPFIWCVLLVLWGYGAIGAADDFLKLTRRNTSGLSGRHKLLLQFLIGGVALAVILSFLPPDIATGVAIPFLKDTYIPLSYFFIVWGLLVMVGSSNAVNLTDGLDGLAVVPIAIAALCFGMIVYLVGHIKFASYLQIPYVPGSGELTVICGALVGACLGFFWYNAHPAEVFMGDTGSLSLGGALGTIALIAKHELVLLIIGGVFVMETLSVIIQVAVYKTTGKRFFRMAPIHHHFEKMGWPETKVVARFWILAVIFALIGLSTLKLR